MKMLVVPSSQVEAFPLNFPETAFYANGLASELIKTDPKTGLLVSITD